MSDVEQDIQLKSEKGEVVVSLNPVLTDLGYTLLLPNTIEIQKSLEEVLGHDTEVIRVLAAGTTMRAINGENTWQSPGFDMNDNNGLSSGGVYRVAAGAIAMKSLPSVTCVVGSKYVNEVQPAPSIVMEKELSMLGFKNERILSDPNTTDTIAELVRLLEICEENGWSNGVCITNEYHCERVASLLDNLDWLSFREERTEKFLNGFKKLKSGELKIKVVAAEEVIQRYSTEIYDRNIPKYLNSEVLQKREEAESNGLNLIHAGQYARYNPKTNSREVIQRF